MSSPNPNSPPQAPTTPPPNGAASAEQVQQAVVVSGAEQVPYSEPKSTSDEFLTDEQLRQELSGHRNDVASPEQVKMLDDFMGKSGEEAVARARQEVGSASSEAQPQPAQPSTPPQQQFMPPQAPQHPTATFPSTPAVAPSPREAMLEQQLQAMAVQMQQLQAMARQSQAPAQPAAPSTPQRNPNLVVPPQLAQAFASEDPVQRQTAVQMLVDGIWSEMTAHLGRQVPEMIQGHVPGMIQSTLTQQQRGQQIEQDFYGNFPEFRDMQDLVAAQAQSMIGQGWVQGWNQQFRDELARRLAPLRPAVLQRLGAPQPQIPQPQIPQQAYGLPPQMTAGYPPVQSVPAAWPQPAQSAPLMVRDATGALRPYSGPQQYMTQPVAQPMAQRLNPQQAEIVDIWSTLGYR